jgi:acetyl-CoA carboxylase carboxyl transferase subunit alpha
MVQMLEHAIYSVISPEGCASILWRDAAQAATAAEALKLTAEDLRGLGIVDRVIPEPIGGAHRAPDEAVQAVGVSIGAALSQLSNLDPAALKQRRREKFLAMGREGLA